MFIMFDNCGKILYSKPFRKGKPNHDEKMFQHHEFDKSSFFWKRSLYVLVVVKANKLKRKYYFSFVSSLQFRDNYGLAYYFFLIFLLYQKILRCTTNLCVTTILTKEVVKIILVVVTRLFCNIYIWISTFLTFDKF